MARKHVLCAYDRCHTFVPMTHNGKYCPECRCKRRYENSMKRLTAPAVTSTGVWIAERDRKNLLAGAREERNQFLLHDSSFAMFDIEASNLDADFGEVLCACIRPIGGPTTTIRLPSFRAGDPWRLVNDTEIVGAIRDELAKYDYVVTWYGTRYDMPYLATRLMAAKEDRLGYLRHIDLYYQARFKLKLHSNRLASVGDFMFGKTKKDSIVGPIWLAALRGDTASMDYIVKHCEKDVVELERVWRELGSYVDVAGVPLRKY